MGPINYPAPVASFGVPSVVLVGTPISVVDNSYDPAPGHSLVQQIWFGRAGSFSAPGTYTISLWVEDDRGRWAFTTRTVTVIARVRRVTAWAIQGGARQAARGEAVSVVVLGASRPVHFEVPAAFALTVPIEGQDVNYASLNAQPFSVSGSQQQGTLYVPWTANDPSDGSWQITVTDGQTSQSFTLVVNGTLQVMPSLRQVTASP
jgi:hypothetical protein